jgi:hypothetical protein
MSLILRPTVSRSVGQSVSRPVCLGIKHPSGAYDQIFITVRQLQVFYVGRPLWREDGSVFYNCCCPSPEQSFSSPSLVGLVTIFYCLRLETSLSVASYISQGNGGGIRPRLHTGTLNCVSKWVSYITTDGQSASLSWNKAPIRGLRPVFLINVRQLRACWCRAPSLTRGRVCLLLCTMYNIFAFYMLSHTKLLFIQVLHGPHRKHRFYYLWRNT